MNQEAKEGGHRSAKPENLQLQTIDNEPVSTEPGKSHRQRE
jgi:hypothetical protein